MGVPKLFLALAAIGGACNLLSVPAYGADAAQYELNIGRQPLASALQEFAKQSGVQIIFLASVTEGHEAPQLSGRFTATDAIALLLDDSDLTFTKLNSKTIEVETKVRALTFLREGSDKAARATFASERSGPLRLAQSSAAPAATAPNPSARSDELQEITVTATRFQQSIDKVPLTVTAITGDQLEQRNIQNVDDLFQDAPGVTFYRTGAGGGSNSQIVIRGIQSTTGAGTTGIYIDDTPVQLHKGGLSFTAQNGYPDIFDLDRVEVLQGPQGTLFGSGAMGGAVRFITRQPSLDLFSLYSKVETGFTEDGDPSYGIGAAVGGPIVPDKLGFRVSMDYHREGGWVDHSSRYALGQQYNINASGQSVVTGTTFGDEPFSNWRQTSSVRAALTFQPVDGFTITPSFTYQGSYQNAQSSFYDFYSDPSEGKFVNGSGVREPEYDHFTLPTLTMRYNFERFSLFSSTSYYDRTETNYYDTTACTIECTPAGFIPVSFPNYFPEFPTLETNLHDLNQQRNFTQEIRAQSADASARLTWQFGAFYEHAVSRSQEFVYLDVATINGVAQALGVATGQSYPNYLDLFCCALLPTDVEYQTLDLVVDDHLAAFGELNYRFFDRLTLTAGVRAERVKSQLTSLQGGPYAGSSTLAGYSASVTETPVTPKFSAAYQIDAGNMVYATVAKGVRPGGSNGILPSFCDASLAASGLAGFTGNFQQDSVWSYEVGSKNKFANNRVSLSGSLYWIDWTGIQESQFLTGQCIQQITFNGNSLTSKGVALQGQFLLAPGLTLGASFDYDDAKFTKPSLGGPSPDGGRTILINKGDGIDGAPPITASLAIQYDVTLFERPSFARLDGQYVSKENMLATTDPTTTAYFPLTRSRPETKIANFRAGMNFDAFQASVFVTNIANSHPIYQSNNGSLDRVTTESITIRPRTVGVTGTYRF